MMHTCLRLALPVAQPHPRCRRERRERRERSAAARASAPTPSPFSSPTVEYNDSWTDLAFIALCRIAYGNLSGWQSDRSWTSGAETFAGMVEVSRSLMKGRTAAQQRDAVIQGFPSVPPWFRRVFPYSKWGAELNARITPAFFTWLVGPMQTIEIDVGDNSKTTQKSGVKIERCRYLAESGVRSHVLEFVPATGADLLHKRVGHAADHDP